MQNDDGITGFSLTYDHQGHPISITALDEELEPVELPEGFCTCLFEYDGRWLEIRKTYLDQFGKPTCHVDGNAAVKYTIDDNESITRYDFLDAQGCLTLTSYGYASEVIVRDDMGRPVSMSFLGAQGEPVTLPRLGYLSVEWNYDNAGRMTSECYFETNGRLVVSPFYGNAGFQNVYDDQDMCGYSYVLGADGLPTFGVAGEYATKYFFDNEWNVASLACLDEDGKPYITRFNYCARDSQSKSGSLGYRYLGVDGKPVRNDDASGYEVSMNDSGQIVRWLWTSSDDRPVSVGGSAGYSVLYADSLAAPLEGYATQNVVREINSFGMDDVCEVTVEHMDLRYDEDGNLIRVSYFDERGEAREIEDWWGLCEDWWGLCHTVSFAYDDSGRPVETCFLDSNGELCTNAPLGYARNTCSYDIDGNIISVRYYGADDKPINAGEADSASIL